jgi:sigma-B regulation protein RsbU (phosphoserine phosphatase)
VSSDQRKTPSADVQALVREVLGAPVSARSGPGGLGWMDEAEPEQQPGKSSGWARPGVKPKNEDLEVEQARHIQQRLLPEPPRLPGLVCAARFEPHHEVSGDFYDFFQFPDGRLGVVQGDVSGHGVAAGMVMAMAKQTIRMLAAGGATPGPVLIEANRWLFDAMAGKFVSCTYLTIDPAKGELRLARAGHPPLILVNAATGARDLLTPKGIALGIRDGAAFAAGSEELRRSLHPGDLLVQATDGILEAKDRLGEEMGVERMIEVIAQHAPAGPAAVVNRILDAARHFQGSAKLDDDAMVVAVGIG